MNDIEKKLNELHNKIDSIYTLLETLSDRLNNMEYSGRISYGNMYDVGKSQKLVNIELKRNEPLTDEEWLNTLKITIQVIGNIGGELWG